MKRNLLRSYLEDPLLSALMAGIRTAGPIHSSMLDITQKNNLQCASCCHFFEQVSRQNDANDDVLDKFIQREVDREINMLIITGGEPAHEIDKLRKLAKHFKLTIVTNGAIPIPLDGLEKARIAISFQDNECQYFSLCDNNKNAMFERALMNYQHDTRAGFYYAFNPILINNIERNIYRIIKNGNYITFDVCSDLSNPAHSYSHESSLSGTNLMINQLISRYPAKIVSSPYIHEILTKHRILGTPWRCEICLSRRHDKSNGVPKRRNSSFEFRTYNADLQSTKQCNMDITSECDSCSDLWAISSWIVGGMKEHLSTYDDFINWLCSTYIVYLQTGFIDWNTGSSLLPALYQKMGISYIL